MTTVERFSAAFLAPPFLRADEESSRGEKTGLGAR
jgi:hypothetical protein